MFETYLKSLKGGQMLAWAGAVAAAILQFCNTNGVPSQTGQLAAAAGALVACLLFFLNPKAKAWVEDHPQDLAATVQAVMGEMQAGGQPRNFSAPKPPAPIPAPPPPAAASLTPDQVVALRALLASAGDA